MPPTKPTPDPPRPAAVPIAVDTKLVAEAQTKAGAKVHGANEACTNYSAWVKLATGTAWWVQGEKDTPALRERAKVQAAAWEKYLRIFAATGEFPKDQKPKVII